MLQQQKYGNMAYIKDRNGRRFWFDPKWSISMLEQYTKES